MHWSKRKNTIDNYILPEYYNSIIKNYIFNDETDIEMFLTFVRGKKFSHVLELGCGSGRATDAFLSTSKPDNLTLVDLSGHMIDFVKEKYDGNEEIFFQKSDHVDYLKNTRDIFDFVYCMWSLSHSVHAHLYKTGVDTGMPELFKVFENFVKNNLAQKGEMYILHFDSTSPEQMILLSQWKKAYPLYVDLTDQSPSKRLLDKVFEHLCRENIIEFSSEHYIGKEIIYKDDEEYLELFMNFHLETFFNNTDMLEEVRTDILKLGEKYKKTDGSYAIKPGCFVYKVKRV